jgi:hypothetical protein
VARTHYENLKAIDYAKFYCGVESNACGVFLAGVGKSDCSHFLAHCLHAGGITIRNPGPAADLCPQGLAFRNPDLVAELRRLAGLYENVKEVDLSETIVGDVGFLILDKPRHSFMVSRPGPLPGPLDVPFVWAHSDKLVEGRCDSQVDTRWRQWFSAAFRLEDG